MGALAGVNSVGKGLERHSFSPNGVVRKQMVWDLGGIAFIGESFGRLSNAVLCGTLVACKKPGGIFELLRYRCEL